MNLDQVVDLLEKAELLGVFDAAWYAQEYGLGFENKLDAFNDYLRKSRHSWVDPSSTFSTKAYFKAHFNSLLDSRISPLEHFLKSELGRTSFLGSKRYWKPSSVLDSAGSFQGSISCAVAAHIFYPDYINKLVDCFHHFPVSIDVFLTVSDRIEISETQKLLSRVECVNNVYIRKTANRGRNFGPLLVEFGEVLLDYDVFCHVHSKKSLFSGSSQELWGEYLFEYLLRDKQILCRALRLFESSKDFGIYFPTAYTRTLPKWASHTLRNKHSSNELCNLLSLPAPEHGFISYPVGGMFWARSEALRPLLSHPWNYNDFPDEPIANDGTILHAIERMLVHISRTQGYSDFVYHPGSGSFTADSTHAKEEYVGTSGDIGYIVQRSSVRVISFDLFDTLVYRVNSYPDQAKEDMGAFLGYQVPSDFVRFRNETEHLLRKELGFVGDVCIVDVYSRILQSIGSELSALELADKELAFDISNMLPRLGMVNALNTALESGKTVFITSDTYYTRLHIKRLLKTFNISEKARLFISSDLGIRKDNGTMWKHIKQLLVDDNINPLRDFVHIGDNVVSDSQLPGDYGIGSYHILNPLEKWNFVSKRRLSESDLQDNQLRAKFGSLVALVGSTPFIE